MLICPQCESENPDNNKFCQRCGNSLTQKPCHQCGTKVDYSEEKCPQCGALTATLRWAIISPSIAVTLATHTDTDTATAEIDTPVEIEETPVTQENSESTLPDVTASATQPSTDPETEAIAENLMAENSESKEEKALSTPSTSALSLEQILIEGEYLDEGKRYRLLSLEKEFLSMQLQSEKQSPLIGVKVIDTKPVQESKLDHLLAELVQLGELKDHLINHQNQIPELVQTYLTLEEYGSIIPRVYDGWQNEQQQVVILEDRSSYLNLSEGFKDESRPLAQILYWLKEMALLWGDLGKYQARQSLLEIDNLCLDEDYTVCLKQLYLDPETGDFSLNDLVKQWQFLLNQANRQCEDFVHLVGKTQQGIILNEKQLCEELEMIARQELASENVEENLMEEVEAEDLSDSDLVTLINQTQSNSMNYTSEGDDIPTIVLPMQLLSLTDSGVTDIGVQRDHNEDFFGIETSMITHGNPMGRFAQAKGLYIVCDGMGGHDAGEVASAMAVEKLQSYFKTHWQDTLPDEELIKEGILTANQAIYDVNMENSRSGSGRMGTTLVMALVQDTKVAIAHVGDSRIYRITRKWGAEQLTIDHEVGQREIQRGVDPDIAYGRPDAYQLTQALGPRSNDFVQPDISFIDINEDSLLLLCSDGLCDNNLVENYWETYLSPLLSSRSNLEKELVKFINFANEYNGHDNITGVVVRIKVRPNLEQMPEA